MNQKVMLVLAKNVEVEKTREKVIMTDTHMTEKMYNYFMNHLDRALAIWYSDTFDVGYLYKTTKYNYEHSK